MIFNCVSGLSKNCGKCKPNSVNYCMNSHYCVSLPSGKESKPREQEVDIETLACVAPFVAKFHWNYVVYNAGGEKKFFDFLRDKAGHGMKKLEDWVHPCDSTLKWLNMYRDSICYR